MKSFEDELISAIEGEVYFDEITRQVYSVDASIFEIKPSGVAVPKTKSELKRIVEIARHFHIPLTMRGAATGITGGCLGHGLIVDLSKYLNKILKVNIQDKYIVCEPGVIQDELNRELAHFGYRLGPDTSTGNRATLGGMLANNAAGSRSLKYGKMSDHTLEVEILSSTDEFIRFFSLSEEEWQVKRQLSNQEGKIYETLWNIREKNAKDIQQHFPPIPRRVSGYNLDELIKPFPLNVSKIIAGSEGTLGIATEIKMGIVPKPKATGLLILFFDDMLDSMSKVPDLLEFHPLSLEMIDHQIIELGRAAPLMRHRLNWLQGNPQAILIFEMEGSSFLDVKEKLNDIQSQIERKKIGYLQIPIFDNIEMENVWEFRKSGLGILLSKRTYNRAIAFIEDISIPPSHLFPFMKRFCEYLVGHGKKAGIYGHVGSGCMHIRPYLDLRNPEELIFMRQMMIDISSLLLEYGGALSGEHGDGWIRSWLNPKMFGDSLMQTFKQIKKAFDPYDLMNPGKIIPLSDQWEELRTSPNEVLQTPKTFLDFQPEGGFALAADLCNGNGLCRKKEKVMCPSFQATNDEFHSTRARAQALRAIIHQRLPLEAFTSQGLYDVMDLCISCKGCKTECPSQVDMAKFKSEFLYHYQNQHGISLRNRLFAHIGPIQSKLSPFASFFNYANQKQFSKKILKWLGISSHRSLPQLTHHRFSKWFEDLIQPSGNKLVILLNDTFTEFNHPEIGQAAVSVLNALDYKVIMPPWKCCGRPALSKGLLPTARKQAKELLQHLWTFAASGLPIIGLEPSCLLTLKDDYLSLIQAKCEQEKQLKQIISQCLTFDEFLAQQMDQGNFNLKFKAQSRKVKVHGHCYQKALVGMEPILKVLKSIPGFEVEEILSGCCGMAGSFGYEAEHDEISMQIGNLVLFPAIRESSPEDWIIANGMSCRHQIKDGTHRHAFHLAEALTISLQS